MACVQLRLSRTFMMCRHLTSATSGAYRSWAVLRLPCPATGEIREDEWNKDRGQTNIRTSRIRRIVAMVSLPLRGAESAASVSPSPAPAVSEHLSAPHLDYKFIDSYSVKVVWCRSSGAPARSPIDVLDHRGWGGGGGGGGGEELQVINTSTEKACDRQSFGRQRLLSTSLYR